MISAWFKAYNFFLTSPLASLTPFKFTVWDWATARDGVLETLSVRHPQTTLGWRTVLDAMEKADWLLSSRKPSRPGLSCWMRWIITSWDALVNQKESFLHPCQKQQQGCAKHSLGSPPRPLYGDTATYEQMSGSVNDWGHTVLQLPSIPMSTWRSPPKKGLQRFYRRRWEYLRKVNAPVIQTYTETK